VYLAGDPPAGEIVDLATYGQFALALVFVLALIGLLAMGARRIGLGPRMVPSRGKKRLAIVEVMPLDPKRRIVLVRRDSTEHLLLLGATQDAVIETGIPAPVDGAPPARPTSPPAQPTT
jgi:flagellar protein FliO/FliZ